MAIITVTTLDDTIVAPDGEVSLREALLAANTDASVDGSDAGSGADIIVFDSSLFGTIGLAQGQLVIASNVIIDGDSDGDGISDITIDAAGASRVLLVLSNTSTLDALVLTGGNDATVGGGGVLVAAGNLTIVNSTIAGNHGMDGGGIHNSGTLTLTNSSIEGNDAYDDGGGLRNSGAGVATLTNVTLSGNHAITGDGGGISNSNDLTLVNVTLSGNFGDRGGGLFNGASGSAAASVLNSTVSGNAAGTGGGIYSDAINHLTLTNSIVLGNEVTGADPDLRGIATYAGVNIVGLGGDNDPDGNVMNAAALTDVFDAVAINGIGVTAGVLADNGGAVDTIAIKIGGTAHDAGDVAALPVDTQDLDGDGVSGLEDLPVDARGAARVFGVDLDIGAFEAGQFIVTTLDDEDYDLGSLTDETLDGDGLSLREALALANADVDANTIVFSTAPGTLTLTQGELAVTTNVTIDGDINGDGAADITVSGSDLNRVFNVDSGAAAAITASLNGLVVRDGFSAFDGGAIRVASDALIITNSTITDNVTQRQGGAIYNSGSITLTNTILSGNQSTQAGGAIMNLGTAHITNTTLSGNHAGADGGAIANYGSSAVLELTNATVSGNDANSGGGIDNTHGSTALINTTVAGNTADVGGGIVNFATTYTSTLTLTNSTVSGNLAVYHGGGIENTSFNADTTLTNSIVAGNDAMIYAGDDVQNDGTLTLHGGNIVGDTRTIDGTPQAGIIALTDIFASVTNNPDTGVLSGTLGANGGPVQTIALNANALNPALDAGDDALAPATDARGFSRDDVAGAANNGANVSDLGAFEVSHSLVVTTDADTVDATDGLMSLREALALANGNPGADTITFDAALAGLTITLAGGELIIASDVTIDGDIDGDDVADITIDANQASRVFFVSGGTSTLDALVITGGDAGTDTGGGVKIQGGDVTIANSTITANEAGSGGGIWNAGTLTLTDTVVAQNYAAFGGGIATYAGSTATLINTTLSANHAADVGGLGGGILGYAGAALTLINSTLSGNSAYGAGGIGSIFSDVTLTNSTLSGNYAGEFGGGIAVTGGTLALTNSIVAGNTAPFNSDISGPVDTLSGGNIVGDTFTIDGTPQGGIIALTDIFAEIDPVTGGGLLQDNGGPVETVALAAAVTNPAIDAGDDTLAGVPATDARGVGFDRVDVPGVAHNGTNISDLGAFELQGPFEAASLIVTTADDVIDPFDNLTSLREALAYAASLAGADIITFDGSFTDIEVDSALVIADDVTIDGDIAGDFDILIDAFDDSRVFDVISGTSTLRHLDVTGGYAAGEDGGGIRIVDGATLTLADVAVFDNHADGDGGGIWNDGTLTLSNSVVVGNTADDDGGGIWNNGSLFLNESAVAVNLAGSGGGIFNSATALLTNTVLAGNTAADIGGGILASASTLTLINSTLSGNSAGAGGGIANIASNVALVNSTVTGNTAGIAGGIGNDGFTDHLTLSNSIVAGNEAVDGNDVQVGADGHTPSYIGGNIVGDTLSQDGTAQPGSFALTDIFAQVGINFYTGALSGVLADNSGPLPTVGIKLGGAAQDTGNDAVLPIDTQDVDHNGNSLEVLQVDARGFDRVSGSHVDLGALELQPGADFIVDTDQDEEFDGGSLLAETLDGDGLSLREALALAQQDKASYDTITFAEALDGGTLFLTQGQELVVEGNVTIDGNSDNDAFAITIDGDADGDGDGDSAVLHVYSGVVALNGLTINNGFALYGAGLTVGYFDGRGYADVTVTNSTIANNVAGYGAGIYVETGSSLRLINSTVSGNQADVGGGILVYSGAALTVTSSTIRDNHAAGFYGYGGGIAVYGGASATLINSTISGNSATDGGGIYNAGELTLINTTLANNIADYGGGLYMNDCGCGNADVISSTITGNYAGIGGGIYHAAGTLNLTNSIVAGNGSSGASYGPDLLALDTVNYSGVNVFSDIGIGDGDDIHETNLANIFATVATFDPTPVDGDEFDAGVLANNGGPVKTVAIKLGGAAFNTGDNAELPPDTEDLNGNGNKTEDLPFDARGLPRISVGTVDVGAFEIQNSPPVQTHNTGLAVNEGASATVTAALLEYNDAQESAANVVYTITAAAAIGTLLLNGSTALGLGGTFTQADINAGHLSYSHDGSETTATSFGFQVSDGVNLPVTGQSFAITINAVNDAPVNSVPGAQALEANHSLALTGLSVTDPDAFAGLMSTTLSVDHGALAAAALGGANVTGSGTDALHITGTLAAINATLAGGNVVYTPTTDYFDNDLLTMVTNDGGHTGIGGPLTDTDTVAINLHTHLFGTPDNDSFVLDLLPAGDIRIDALGGFGDTLTLNFRLVDASVRYVGNTVIIDGPSRHLVVTGFEKYEFTDGTVDNNDGIRLVDDLFYYSNYHDVWNAHADAEAHFVSFGRDEGRDPNAFFSTVVYRSANPDVAAAGINPLDHFDATGWLEGRVPSIHFDPAQYLAANPDVAAAGVDPLRHYLQFGYQEGRQPFAPSELIASNGFDYVWYLNHNPDVAAANIDAFAHFMTVGWTEGRNPNALFDVNGYLATYGDVAAAHINPLTHYNQFGWQEGRDPSVGFDTTSYLAAYADVAAAHVNPLTHFLQFGIHEGRSPFADGVWG